MKSTASPKINRSGQHNTVHQRVSQATRIVVDNRASIAQQQKAQALIMSSARVTAQRMHLSPTGTQVAQRDTIPVYRVGRTSTNSAQKVVVEKGKVSDVNGGDWETGIDFSFGSDEHAKVYAADRVDKEDLEVVKIDFPKKIYDMMLAKAYPNKYKAHSNWANDEDWKKINKLRSINNSKDQIVQELGILAPHFSQDWMKFLSEHLKGQPATVESGEKFLGLDQNGPFWIYPPNNPMDGYEVDEIEEEEIPEDHVYCTRRIALIRDYYR